MAFRELEGVGDAAAGEWVEIGREGVMHVRRRLTAQEAARVNEVRDIRGTAEERKRLAALLKDAPHLALLVGLMRPIALLVILAGSLAQCWGVLP